MSRRPLNKRYVLMLRWGAPGLIAALVISLLVLIGGVRKDPAALNADGGVDGLTSILSREITPDMVRFTFDDVTNTAGISFRHFPAVRQSLLPEDMGSGVAWGDYDNDGDPDLFLVNFHGSILDPIPDHPQRGRCALYRNDLNGTFTDVSAEAGLDVALFGMAAAWGDYDNDDDLDLYITAYGRNLLFENNGDGTFTDITEAAGVGDESFSAGCAWTDYNGDGLIDLYVCNYVQFVHRKGDASRNTRQYGSEIPYTINPSSYLPQSNRMYRNNGDGTFTDVAKEIGVDNPDGRSLGVVCFDFDDDGLIDLYVANDVSSNGVFRNRGDGTFADIGAVSLAADYRGAMGLAVGDYDHDDDFDLFVTHWIAQENAFFENMFSEGWTDDAGKRRVMFMDNSEVAGLGQISLKTVGWATGFADFDNDGHADLWVVNGNTLEQRDDHTRLKPQQLHLFRQEPGEGFYEIGRQACPSLANEFVGRGGAYADYDLDGRIDLLAMRFGEGPLLLHNSTENDHHWISIRLRQDQLNTRALGARITITCGELIQTAQVGADGSYLSQHQLDLHFGLGESDTVDELTITWPDGSVQTEHDLQADRVHTFRHLPGR